MGKCLVIIVIFTLSLGVFCEKQFQLSRTKKDLPVVVLVMGGAWIIGYKAWSALLAKYLSENGNKELNGNKHNRSPCGCSRL